MADLALLAEELDVLVGVALELRFAGLEQGLGFIELSLLSEEEGEALLEEGEVTGMGLGPAAACLIVSRAGLTPGQLDETPPPP